MDRFERLFALQENLYSENAPLILGAGVLLKDTRTDNLVVQLKFQSVSVRAIKAVKVTVDARDVAGAELEGVDDYQYLDIYIQSGEQFGTDKAILLPDRRTRAVKIGSITVVYADDNETYTWSEFRELPERKRLSQQWEDGELIKQYSIEIMTNAVYFPRSSMGLWMCACGRWNKQDSCGKCNAKRNAVFLLCDEKIMGEKKKERLELERMERKRREEARIAAQKAENERIEKEGQERENEKRLRREKIKKGILVLLVIFFATALIGAMFRIVASTNKTKNSTGTQVVNEYSDQIEDAIDRNSNLDKMLEQIQSTTDEPVMTGGDAETDEMEDDGHVPFAVDTLEAGAFKEMCRYVDQSLIQHSEDGWYITFAKRGNRNERSYHDFVFTVKEDNTVEFFEMECYHSVSGQTESFTHGICYNDNIAWDDEEQCYIVTESVQFKRKDGNTPAAIICKVSMGINSVYIDTDNAEAWAYIDENDLPLWIEAEN